MSDRLKHVDLETERVVLGQILLDDAAWSIYAQAGLTVEDFFRSAHRDIASACASLEADAEPVHGLTVKARLVDRAQLDDVGGPGYLFGLSDGCPAVDAASARWAVGRLRSLATARRAAHLAQQLAAAETMDASTLAAHASAVDALVEQGDAHGSDATSQVDALFAARAHERTQALRLGVPGLDEPLDGLRAGEVCGIMARTSVGKTLVACHVAHTLVQDGAGVVFISLEMAQAQIVERLARLLTGQTRHQLRWQLDNGRFATQDYLQRFATLHVIDTPGISLAAIERRVRAIQRRQTIGAVVIDYLGLVGGDRGSSTYDRTSNTARDLKDVAKRLGVAILPLIQVSRQGGDDGAQELGIGAGRDSGVVEEAVDYLVALRRLDRSMKLGESDRERFRDVLFARLVKNRHGMVSPREVAIRVNPASLALAEDPSLVIDEHTNARTRKAEVRL
jgi:replicative DNA helicase